MPLKKVQSWRNGVGPAGADGRGRANRPMVQPSRRVAASRMFIMSLTEEQVNKEGLAWTVVGECQEPWGGTDPTPWLGVQEIKNRNSANIYYVPTPSTVNRPTPRCGWGAAPDRRRVCMVLAWGSSPGRLPLPGSATQAPGLGWGFLIPVRICLHVTPGLPPVSPRHPVPLSTSLS